MVSSVFMASNVFWNHPTSFHPPLYHENKSVQIEYDLHTQKLSQGAFPCNNRVHSSQKLRSGLNFLDGLIVKSNNSGYTTQVESQQIAAVPTSHAFYCLMDVAPVAE